MSVPDDEEATKLFRVRRTALQMLDDRGYAVKESDLNMTKQKFVEQFGANVKREDLLIETEKRDDASNRIFVIFPEVQKKVGCAIVKDCIVRMHAQNVSRAILVVQQALTPQAKAAVNEVNRKFQIETFQEAELLVNVTEHYLVPKHEVLSTEQRQELFQKYNVKSIQLPRMLVTDPVARYFGLKPGQVVKITRPSETAGTYITYRCVV
ncbi:DNA-directed RNA polymerases II and IV subunit 5A like [Actinidia chinensis var. chinensis]|uniref:DNA-directed RNA polymerases II and IV subunit 5A like n=1 Tax=Actinidia chinensis var. chinensis TaxID=1590841 RepID=A0A2R6P4L4_ACTCC|nr:DNA-directed RNA polymerases II and IV subunit 5A-like [Actinidia eriantha]PSR85221.1 DNA-directed RNA polymerases II and IV subunit 5A like [Actinidia chinensis var. chinensis]